MRILRFDCVGGASGDMILGALVQLGADLEVIEQEIRRLIPDENFSFLVGEKREFGASGIHLTVKTEHGHEHEHEHEHGHEHEHEHGYEHGRSWSAIRLMLERCHLDKKTKLDALAAFGALASAESEAHTIPIDQVHFHEVGSVDSIVDTVGCVLALNMLEIDAVSLSPLPVGEGTFRCAHGVYPLPAPATAILLRDYSLPISYDVEQCEMLTPTATSLFATWKKASIPNGARIVATANSFGTRRMKMRPNLLRACIYETNERTVKSVFSSEDIYVFETNIDDATGERMGATASALFNSGAVDVWFEQIQMKKCRPAIKLCAMVRDNAREAVLATIFRHSGVFGVREMVKRRYFLERRWEKVSTKYGLARVKIGVDCNGSIVSVSPEYEDCSTLALASNVTFNEVYLETLKQYWN